VLFTGLGIRPREPEAGRGLPVSRSSRKHFSEGMFKNIVIYTPCDRHTRMFGLLWWSVDTTNTSGMCLSRTRNNLLGREQDSGGGGRLFAGAVTFMRGALPCDRHTRIFALL
jgi:hypothetical protein